MMYCEWCSLLQMNCVVCGRGVVDATPQANGRLRPPDVPGREIYLSVDEIPDSAPNATSDELVA
jgi:hypothetical protein